MGANIFVYIDWYKKLVIPLYGKQGMINVCTEAQHELKKINIEDGHVAKLQSNGSMKDAQNYHINGENKEGISERQNQ
jgi:hypothetical protein